MDDAGLTQDPHRLRDKGEARLEAAIGRELRALRQRRGMTISDLAAQSGLSVSMLSKIENGNTSASLSSLEALSNALGLPITAFFRRFEEEHPVVHVKAGEGLDTDRAGTRAGHQYQLLGHLGANDSGVTVEPYLITLTDASDVFPTFQHDGIEMIYVLEGAVDYRHGEALYALRPGDTLFFDADTAHGPEVLVELPARFLSVISYPQQRKK